MTYQRNMCVLEDAVDQGLPDGVHETEPAAGHEDEAQHDGRGLEDVLAVRPLHTTQLVDAGAQERDDAVAALATLARGRVLLATAAAARGSEPRGRLHLV